MTETPVNSAPGQVEALTDRERQILGMFAQGLQNKVVAAHLSISEQTVKAHAKSIYRKLQMTSRYQAMLRIVQPSPSEAGAMGACARIGGTARWAGSIGESGVVIQVNAFRSLAVPLCLAVRPCLNSSRSRWNLVMNRGEGRAMLHSTAG
jgi:DNA-binding CsgD family transcriptional regulator